MDIKGRCEGPGGWCTLHNQSKLICLEELWECLPEARESLGRPPVTSQDLERTEQLFRESLMKRIERFGDSTFFSKHHGLGILAEEYHEHMVAVHGNNEVQVLLEAIDIAVAAYWQAASQIVKHPEAWRYLKGGL